MRARHVTSEREYRSPFGAVQLGGTVSLSIDVWEDDVTFCTLRVWTDAHGEELIEMRGAEHAGGLRFTATYKPAETGVVWYSFDIEASDGAVWRYGAREGWVTGEGAFAYGDPPSFQITVFSPRARQPRWYREGIVYQIFPDRFARGEDWRERAADTLAVRRKGGPDREVLEDWDTPPTYRRLENGDVACWDFYGGTLEGIREKLGYLEDLGVTAIYLNPIFEAASNHRYDTADYLRIDPLLGDEESFRALYLKQEAGADYLVSQLFFDNEDFYRFREKCLRHRVRLPIVAGIMPFTSVKQIQRMAFTCGASIPAKVVKRLVLAGDDPADQARAGVEYACEQLCDLAANGVDGLHVYSMNKPSVAHAAHEALLACDYLEA